MPDQSSDWAYCQQQEHESINGYYWSVPEYIPPVVFAQHDSSFIPTYRPAPTSKITRTRSNRVAWDDDPWNSARCWSLVVRQAADGSNNSVATREPPLVRSRATRRSRRNDTRQDGSSKQKDRLSLPLPASSSRPPRPTSLPADALVPPVEPLRIQKRKLSGSSSTLPPLTEALKESLEPSTSTTPSLSPALQQRIDQPKRKKTLEYAWQLLSSPTKPSSNLGSPDAAKRHSLPTTLPSSPQNTKPPKPKLTPIITNFTSPMPSASQPHNPVPFLPNPHRSPSPPVLASRNSVDPGYPTAPRPIPESTPVRYPIPIRHNGAELKVTWSSKRMSWDVSLSEPKPPSALPTPQFGSSWQQGPQNPPQSSSLAPTSRSTRPSSIASTLSSKSSTIPLAPYEDAGSNQQRRLSTMSLPDIQPYLLRRPKFDLPPLSEAGFAPSPMDPLLVPTDKQEPTANSSSIAKPSLPVDHIPQSHSAPSFQSRFLNADLASIVEALSRPDSPITEAQVQSRQEATPSPSPSPQGAAVSPEWLLGASVSRSSTLGSVWSQSSFHKSPSVQVKGQAHMDALVAARDAQDREDELAISNVVDWAVVNAVLEAANRERSGTPTLSESRTASNHSCHSGDTENEPLPRIRTVSTSLCPAVSLPSVDEAMWARRVEDEKTKEENEREAAIDAIRSLLLKRGTSRLYGPL